jgi:hypothetical protein
MGLLDQAIEAEAQAQAICMQTKDFERAYQRLRGQGKTAVCRGLRLGKPRGAAPDPGIFEQRG